MQANNISAQITWEMKSAKVLSKDNQATARFISISNDAVGHTYPD